ncbi:MAG: phosphoglucosamine mutase [Verrucomicrobiaceae bacterium]
MAELFGTDGIRGVANEYPITPEIALRVGRAVARVLKARKVVIGRDTRASGPMLESALTSGLVSDGADVISVGGVPTPAIPFLIKELEADAGVMLTASHNPFTDNGIKIFGGDGYKLNNDLELAVESLILGERLQPQAVNVGGVVHLSDGIDRFVEFTKKAVGEISLEGLKIVMDCAHGAGYAAAPRILRELGAEVVAFGDAPNGRNINEGCGSMHPAKAVDLVRGYGADIGICLDGDADRVLFLDEEGEVINGDRILCLCAKEMHKRGKLKGGALVATVMSNLGLRDSLEKDGIQLELTGVGDRLVLERMRERNLSLGGENSGHIIFADFATTGDGILSALMVLSFMRESGKKLSELVDCMSEYPQKMINIPVKKKPPLEEVPSIVEAMKSAELALGSLGRILVRYSGTEKKLRVLVEAKDAQLAEFHCKAIVAAAERAIG